MHSWNSHKFQDTPAGATVMRYEITIAFASIMFSYVPLKTSNKFWLGTLVLRAMHGPFGYCFLSKTQT